MNNKIQNTIRFSTYFILPLLMVSGLLDRVEAACTHDGFCDRPIQMGVSISNTPSSPFIYAGTAGMRVRSLNNPSLKFILSNNHVLGAVGPTLCPNTADGWPPPLTWSLQPGTLDLGFDPGNDPTYIAGVVFRLVPMDFSFGANNVVDAAIAYTTPGLASTEILGIGQPNPALGQAMVGMPLTKSGRTTGVTTGSVTAVNSTVNVSYGSCGTARFVQQIITTAGLGDSGDSGAAVLDENSLTPVGLYFAGSLFNGVANPILSVYQELGVFVDTDATQVVTSQTDLRRQAAALPLDPRVEAIKLVQARHEAGILAVPGIAGVGIGLDEVGEKMALVVFTEKLGDAIRSAIPATIEGIPVHLVESGPFEAH